MSRAASGGQRQSSRPGQAQSCHPGHSLLRTQPAAHLSEMEPMAPSSSFTFRPVFAAVSAVGRGISELRSRLQVIRRPLADRARSLVPPEMGAQRSWHRGGTPQRRA